MLRKYPNQLIGYDSVGVTEFGFYGSDSEEVYYENYKKMPIDWYYKDNRLSYIRNSNGHRSVEIDELPNDFILTIGCSKTVGSAVELEHTYPYLLSKHLNIAYYNLAVEASGYDLLSHNLSTFLQIKKPKLVIIQWPETYRTFRGTDSITPIGPWSIDLPKNEYSNDFKLVANTDYLEHYSHIIRYNIQSMLQLLDVKFVEISVEELDYGRDLKHPGIESHLSVFEHIVNEVGL